jgi:hypothetical protein
VLSTTTPLTGINTTELAVNDTRWAMQRWKSAIGTQQVSERSDVGPDDGGLLAVHRSEWHAFYTNGAFLSVDHPRLEQFYWVTQYKLGSGMGT